MESLRSGRRTLAVVALLATTHGLATAQSSDGARAPERARGRWSVVRPLLEGALAGLGLGAAYVSDESEGWLMRDENAVRAGLATGIASALAVYAVSGRLRPDAADRPRLRIALGGSSESAREYTLAIRAPVARRLELEAMMLVRNADWERSERQTRCGSFVGCIDGTYIVDHRYRQTLAGLARAAYNLPSAGDLTPVLSVGAGPMVSHVEQAGVPSARHRGVLGDLGLGLELGRVSRWTLEVGARGPVLSGGAARGTGPEVAVRVGRAFGYR